MEKFTALSLKNKIGVVAALVAVIGAFLPFFSFMGFSVAWREGNTKAWIGLAAIIVGAVFIVLGNKIVAVAGFAVGALILLLDLTDVAGTGVSLGLGAILLIVAVGAGLFVTISNLVAKKA